VLLVPWSIAATSRLLPPAAIVQFDILPNSQSDLLSSATLT
jgi:hypothetical protein